MASGKATGKVIKNSTTPIQWQYVRGHVKASILATPSFPSRHGKILSKTQSITIPMEHIIQHIKKLVTLSNIH